MKGLVRRQGRRFAIACVCIIALVVWAGVAPFLADALVVDSPMAQADAIVILSGAADFAQRAEGGANGYKAGLARQVLITDDDQRGGWDDRTKDNPFFVQRMEAALEKHGVPLEAISVISGKVAGTGDEARVVIAEVRNRGYERILIVTSDFHSRRALWAFKRAAEADKARVEVGLLRSPSGPQYPGRLTWWLTPRGIRTVGGEYVKFGYYWLFY